MNKEIIKSNTEKDGTSAVSTYQKEEKQEYVRRYAMPQGARRVWLENNRAGSENEIIFPDTRAARRADADTEERRKKAKLLIFSLCVAAVLMAASFFIIHVMSRLVIKEVKVEGGMYSAEELLKVSGLSAEDKLPLFSAGKIEDRLLSGLPHIKTCKVSFDLPDTLIYTLTEETPAVYAEIFGEYYSMTSSLKLLERSESEDAFTDLLYIKLPRVKRAVVGEKLILADNADGDYITDFLKLYEESELSGRAGIVYFDEKYDMVLSVDDKFRILLGSPTEMSLKLQAAAHIIKQNEENCNSGSLIDVRVVDVAGIVVNADIDPNARE